MAADKEFIPPLSSRHSTTESDLSGKYVSEKGIEEYYDKIKNQSVLLCRENGKNVGFMSFIVNHSVTVNDSRIDCLTCWRKNLLLLNPRLYGRLIGRSLSMHMRNMLKPQLLWQKKSALKYL